MVEEANFENTSLISKELKLDPKKVLISITDTSGNIEYCNDDFLEVTGFDTIALVGSQHNLMRHADMPSTLYKYLWERLEKEEELSAIIKNNDKDGNYYWVTVDFLIRRNEDGKVIGYRANRKPASIKAIDTMTPIYEKLLYIESISGIDLALIFFTEYFGRRNMTYDGFIESIINPYNNSATNVSAKKKRFAKIRSFLKKN